MRRLGLVPLLGALALGLGGCGDDDGDRSKVDRAEDDVQEAVDGVLHDLADRAGLEFDAGNRTFGICGESYAPGGVRIRSHLLFDGPAELTNEEVVEQGMGALESDGWAVERAPDPEIVTATKGVVELFIDVRGPVQVDVGTECIETGDEVARETDDRPDADLEWQ